VNKTIVNIHTQLHFFIQTNRPSNSTNTSEIAYCVNIAFKKSSVSSGLADLFLSRIWPAGHSTVHSTDIEEQQQQQQQQQPLLPPLPPANALF